MISLLLKNIQLLLLLPLRFFGTASSGSEERTWPRVLATAAVVSCAPDAAPPPQAALRSGTKGQVRLQVALPLHAAPTRPAAGLLPLHGARGSVRGVHGPAPVRAGRVPAHGGASAASRPRDTDAQDRAARHRGAPPSPRRRRRPGWGSACPCAPHRSAARPQHPLRVFIFNPGRSCRCCSRLARLCRGFSGSRSSTFS